jgi:hypothetical protein
MEPGGSPGRDARIAAGVLKKFTYAIAVTPGSPMMEGVAARSVDFCDLRVSASKSMSSCKRTRAG